jgi:hypothetical protein
MMKTWMSFCLIAAAFASLGAAEITKSPIATAKKTSGARKVVAALQTGTYSVDSTIVRKILDTNGLSNLAVSDVSDSAHGRITSLTLEETILSNLPADIGNLVAMKYLDLNGDGLTSLPAEIGNLSALNSLDLSNNSLTSLPTGIGNLVVLNSLYLSNNSLIRLPAELGNLKNLCSLSVEGNNLSELPGSIGQLASLRFLDLKTNKLSDLPGNIIFLKIPPETTWVMVPCPAACPIAKELVSELLLAGNLLCNLPDSVRSWVMEYAPGDLQLQTCNNSVRNVSAVQPNGLFKITQTQTCLLISCASLQDEDLELRVFAVNGRLIKSDKLHGRAGNLSYVLLKYFLAKGMNIIQISGRNSRYLMHSIVE